MTVAKSLIQESASWIKYSEVRTFTVINSLISVFLLQLDFLFEPMKILYIEPVRNF